MIAKCLVCEVPGEEGTDEERLHPEPPECPVLYSTAKIPPTFETSMAPRPENIELPTFGLSASSDSFDPSYGHTEDHFRHGKRQ